MSERSTENDARRPGCEMHGCSTAAVGIGDIDGDEYWLCDKHRYPIPPEVGDK